MQVHDDVEGTLVCTHGVDIVVGASCDTLRCALPTVD